MHALPEQGRIVRYAVRALQKRYRSPRLNNKDDPLDELIFILLSQMTTGPSYERVFDRLKLEMGDWSRLTSIDLRSLKSLISDAGLSNQKAPRLKAIAKRLRKDFGVVSLAALEHMDDETAEQYLTSLPGVGVKTAKCVMMYSLARTVLPVDTHVQRVSKRLGLLPVKIAAGKVHAFLEAVIPPRVRYSFHVNAIAHGRQLCRARAPLCSACPLRKLCISSPRTRPA